MVKEEVRLDFLLGLINDCGLHPGSRWELSGEGFFLETWPTGLVVVVTEVLVVEAKHHHFDSDSKSLLIRAGK